MPIVATQHERHLGRLVGSGQCVAFVREVTGLPPTTAWRRGVPVCGGDHPRFTAIATFNASGRYPNRTDGSSHAAILVTTHEDGSITVLDQWVVADKPQPVHARIIRNKRGSGAAINDSSRYYTIELQDDGDG